MKTASSDIALGVGVVLLIALVAYSAGGVGGVLHVAILWAGAGLALFLWKKESRAANVLAVILAPAILLTYLLPRKLKRAIQSLDQTKP
jgi:apolipoprotein N-acyltransferase